MKTNVLQGRLRPATGARYQRAPADGEERAHQALPKDGTHCAATESAAAPRWATMAAFLAPDLFSVAAVALAAEAATRLWGLPNLTLHLSLITGLLLLALAAAGLYHRALVMHPVREMRRAGLVTAGVVWTYSAAIALAGTSSPALPVGLATAGSILALLLPAARAIARIVLARTNWWGAPVLVIAAGDGAGEAVVRDLKRWPELGLRPTAVLRPEGDGLTEDVNGVPMLGNLEMAPPLISAYQIPYVIVALPDAERRDLIGVLRRCSRHCRQVLVAAGDVSTAAALWTTRQSFDGFLGYSVQHDGPSRVLQRLKRVVDVVGALALALVLAPVLLAIAALIKLDSAGAALYRQVRVGRAGRRFEMLKFRTMHTDAEDRLASMLRNDDALRSEYQKYRKLQNDPRVTRVGRWLRRYSLDELPQLWNILKGDMSFVGPRAYMPDEMSRMNGFEDVILESRPGLSGLWQVSGRNALSFAERTRLDVHYIHHWSPWLDFYIVMRSIPVVLEGNRAA